MDEPTCDNTIVGTRMESWTGLRFNLRLNPASLIIIMRDWPERRKGGDWIASLFVLQVEEPLEVEPGLHFDDARTQSALRLAQVSAQDVRLRVPEIQFVEQIVKIHAELQFGTFPEDLV
jgi:hypothetical protein